ncbi:MAG: lipid-binding SYLF domain-containing protein [Opitutaceae bacterium]
MKTPVLLACALGLSLFTLSSPAFAQRELQRKDYVTQLDSCEAILREFQADPATAIPKAVLARARAIVVTNQFKAGFILGVKDGYGILMVKKADGRWSVPAIIRAGEASLGLQIGGRAIETIYVFTDDRTPRMLFTQRLNVGVDAAAVAGPKVAETERTTGDVLKAPVLLYTKAKGLYAGATVKTGFLMRDDKANRVLYSTEYTIPEIVDSDWITPPSEVQPLMNYVQSIAP